MRANGTNKPCSLLQLLHLTLSVFGNLPPFVTLRAFSDMDCVSTVVLVSSTCLYLPFHTCHNEYM